MMIDKGKKADGSDWGVMYPSGSDCSSSYTDLGRPPASVQTEAAGECSQCPSRAGNGGSWAGLDVVSSTLARGWADIGERHHLLTIDESLLSVSTSCKACSDARLSHREQQEKHLHPGCVGGDDDTGICPSSEWSAEAEQFWPPHQCNPCCASEALACSHHCDGDGGATLLCQNEICCTRANKLPTPGYEPLQCHVYTSDCQTAKFSGQDTELATLSDNSEGNLPLCLTVIPPPPASSSTVSNRCQSPSCLALFHEPPCLHHARDKRTASPEALRATTKHESTSSSSQQNLHQDCSSTLPSRSSCLSQLSRALPSQASKTSCHSITCSNTNMSRAALSCQDTDSRLSQSLEDLPQDIREHILKCKCPCDHLGYGNCSTTSLHQVSSLSNGFPCQSPSASFTDPDDSRHCIASLNKRREICSDAVVWGTIVAVISLVALGSVGVAIPLALRGDPAADLTQRMHTAELLLTETPLIDGHNDLPWNVRKFMHNKLHAFNFTAELNKLRPWSRSSWSHTDLPRLKKGHVSAQFWAAYVPCGSQFLNAVQLTIEQLDLIRRMVDQYPEFLQLAMTADEVRDAFLKGRVASLVGVEGGHAIQNSLGVLRALHALGARYMTLTHTCSTAWAESARPSEESPRDPGSPEGLTHFGKAVVREMNRLGLMVDLSHTSQATMRDALATTKAPIIFSHSSVYSICASPRNVPDDVLRDLAANGGIVMVSFYSHFLTCGEEAEVMDVIKHINHIRRVAGVDHIGIGADFDGVNKLPKGLEDVSTYPRLFAELLADPSWSIEDLKKLAGLNILRVMEKVEEVSNELKTKGVTPTEDEVPTSQLQRPENCSFVFVKDSGS